MDEWGTYLLDSSDMSCDVLDGDGVLDCESVALAFHPGFVDQNAPIGSKTFICE